ncbi:MAG: LuxR family transcriptional regulator [Devosia sp.]|nr:LuxR family transcriptional regulator [Devosia sp.]
MQPDILATISAVQLETDKFRTLGHVLSYARSFGFHRMIAVALPGPNSGLRSCVLVSNLDPRFQLNFANKDFLHIDEVARQCFVTTQPFSWKAMSETRPEPARPVELADGLAIPVHLDQGRVGFIAVVGPAEMLTEAQKVEFHMLGIYAYIRLAELHEQEFEATLQRMLTGRESEVLQWVAHGKTAADIADITGTSERTVNQHCENARRKLGTMNRTHTVVEALRHKFITL